MEAQDFLLIMELIDGSYQNFRLTDNVIKAYYSFLGKYKNKDLWYAVTYWVKHNDNAPTIRNLLEMMGDK